ncbi:MAG TPA: ChaN family lipoprotein [Magnetospirillum sp.]|jgi:uncharacterized iron-regulated protein|nr:ChaN family lipoprotein [Magnetospirillum sp.]
MLLALLILLGLAAPIAIPLATDQPPAYVAPLERDHTLVGKVWLPASQSFIEPAELVTRAEAADAVLLGETHDNPDHHALQAWMLARLLASGKRPLVAFEMIDAGQAQALDRYLAASPTDAAGLGDALDWDKSGWPAWSMYRPIAEAAMQAGVPLAPANLTREQVRALIKAEPEKPLPPLPSEQAGALEHEIAESHCGMLPAAALPGMVRVQRSRDAVMAETLAKGMARQQAAVLIAGAGHVRTDRGVPVALSREAPAAKVLSIAFLEVKDGETDPAAYGGLFDTDRLPFDAVWFTPRAEREDQCEALKRHLERKKG